MTQACNGEHPQDKNGNQLYCLWCPKILDMLNHKNKATRKAKELFESEYTGNKDYLIANFNKFMAE